MTAICRRVIRATLLALPSCPQTYQNGASEPELDQFVATICSQLEIFVNRMKSNSSRGRPIANDSSVQTLFMNVTAMHSQLLHNIQLQDDQRGEPGWAAREGL